MESFEVKILEIPNSPKTYRYGMRIPPQEQEMWDVVVKETQKRPHQKYIVHFLNTTWEPDGGEYIENDLYQKDIIYKIPTGTWTYWLKIYVEDR